MKSVINLGMSTSDLLCNVMNSQLWLRLRLIQVIEIEVGSTDKNHYAQELKYRT